MPLCGISDRKLATQLYSAFIAPSTYAHSTALIGNKIYFFGGLHLTEVDAYAYNYVYYLDVSGNFDTSSPPWTDLTSTAAIPYGSSWATASVGGVDNTQVFLFGGATRDPVTNTDTFLGMTYMFDSKSSSWKKPTLSGTEPSRRREMHAVHDNNGKIYLFGGATNNLTGSPTPIWFNDMVIIDTIAMSYSTGSIANVPFPRIDYSVEILPNGLILYIGGREATTNTTSEVVALSNITTYDTKSSVWGSVVASGGSTLESRYQHSSVLSPDGLIICYGGTNANNVAVTPQLIVLNTTSSPFSWSAPTVSGKYPPTLVLHSAHLVNDFMIIAFGNITNPTGPPLSTSSALYVLDTKSYTWTTSFSTNSTSTSGSPSATSTSKPTSTNTASSSSSISTVTLIGIVAGAGVGGVLLCAVIGFLLIRRRKNNEYDHPDGVLQIPSSSARADELQPNYANNMRADEFQPNYAHNMRADEFQPNYLNNAQTRQPPIPDEFQPNYMNQQSQHYAPR
ncbi:7692_t:CDS:2 [Acaulospora morrowiae]|uniref:7692_t:CDS:1 n=1 Tax=Acaulospora morrowiae TaxID=94023 RepID=A0A9N9GA30_9GLOM|nr:7692_t:CDS:2 [Acaulospora morrowiae]